MQISNENLTIVEPYEVIEAGGNFRLHQYRMFQYVIGECYASYTCPGNTAVRHLLLKIIR